MNKEITEWSEAHGEDLKSIDQALSDAKDRKISLLNERIKQLEKESRIKQLEKELDDLRFIYEQLCK